MEDVLEAHIRPPRQERPLVCLDEFAKPLLSDSSQSIPARLGHAAKQDYEYVPEGSTSGFIIALPHLGKLDAFVGVDARRTAVDLVACLDHIAHVMRPDAERIVLVMDNPNTHNTASLYAPPREGVRVV
jgi:hypothetical protein